MTPTPATSDTTSCWKPDSIQAVARASFGSTPYAADQRSIDARTAVVRHGRRLRERVPGRQSGQRAGGEREPLPGHDDRAQLEAALVREQERADAVALGDREEALAGGHDMRRADRRREHT